MGSKGLKDVHIALRRKITAQDRPQKGQVPDYCYADRNQQAFLWGFQFLFSCLYLCKHPGLEYRLAVYDAVDAEVQVRAVELEHLPQELLKLVLVLIHVASLP